MIASNNELLQMFDLRTAKEINKYNFCKDTVNSIEVNKTHNCIACCDDSGTGCLCCGLKKFCIKLTGKFLIFI